MKLVERYLHAIRFWLPKGQQDDILRELAEDLHSEIEERESELGRPLGEAEIGELLKRRGAPALVAGRYLPQRSLVGPVLYPMYRLALRTVFLSYLVLWLLVPMILIVFSPSYRGARSAVDRMGDLWGSLCVASAVLFSLVTLQFAWLERRQARSNALESWKPADLPRIPDARTIQRSSSFAGMLMASMFLAWWVDATSGPAGDSWSWGPVWQDLQERFRLAVVLLLAVAIALHGANLLRPWWSRLRLGIRAANGAVAGAMLLVVLEPHRAQVRAQWIELTASQASLTETAAEANVANIAVFVGLSLIAVLCVVSAVRDLVRLLRMQRRSAPASGGAVASSP